MVGEHSPTWQWSFEEASGTNAADDSGNSRDGTYSSEVNTTFEVAPTAPTQAPAAASYSRLGNGVTFSSGAYVSRASLPTTSGTAATLYFWMDYAPSGLTWQMEVYDGSGSALNIYRNSSGASMYTSPGSTANLGANTGGLHQWISVVEAAGRKFYQDGFLVHTSGAVTVPSQTSPVTAAVGARYNGTSPCPGTFHLAGFLDGVAMTAAQVRAAWEDATGFVHYYHSKIDDALSATADVDHHYPGLDGTNTGFGQRVIDASGNEAHGTSQNNTALATAEAGDGLWRAYTLDGNNDYIDASANGITLSGDYTIAFKFRHDTGTSNERQLYGQTTSSTDELYLRLDASDDLVLTFTDGTNTDTVTVTGSFRDDAWHDVVIRLDNTGNTLDMWVDGVKATGASITAVGTRTATARYGGGNGFTTTQYLDGEIAGMTQYGSARSDADCAALWT